ncbi:MULTISPECIES: M56 family metallopeptidase [unclassified Clostridioides]|uniref:M56 family metallopeptidase n=1 Tax=unclassified Clostridioides TaxID=2635829 RepID=UPI001D1100AD
MLSILNDFLRTVLVSSLFTVLLLVFRMTIFKIFSRRFNYYIWFIVIIKLLLPFTYYTFAFNEFKYQENINKVNLEGFNNLSTLCTMILVSVWATITIFYLISTLWKYIKLKNLIDDLSYEVDDKYINNLYSNLLKELNINKNIQIKYSHEVETPSFFNSCILLPPYDYTLKELEWIFRHELMHFKSKDLCIKYLVLFLKIVYWFNPFMYIMDKIIDLDCELYCDERVLKNRSIEDKKEYALTVINAMKKDLNSSNKFVARLHKKSDIKKEYLICLMKKIEQVF